MSPDSTIMLSFTVVGIAAQLYTGALPERATVTSWEPGSSDAGRVDGLCLQAGAAGLAVGATASWAARSWWPFLAALAIVVYLGSAYAVAGRTGQTVPRPVQPEPGGGLNIRWQA